MSQTSTSTTVAFAGVNPIFRVKDIAASLDYYVQKLGFKIDWRAPDSYFASVSRGRCGIFLCQGDQGHLGTWVWIGVEDAEALFREYQGSGARIRHPPTNYSWAYEMQVEDLDGNVLRLGSDQKSDQGIGDWLDMSGNRWTLAADGEWVRAEKSSS